MTLKYYITAFACLCASFMNADNYVLINQIMYDSPWNEVVTRPPYSNGEFVELYNGGTESVDMEGWVLTGDGTTEHFTIPEGCVLASGGYLIVAYRHILTPTYHLTDSFLIPTNIPVLYQHAVVLSNGSNNGETLTLYNANSEIVDQVYYDGTSHKTKPNRLYAENADSIPGMECVSLHRTWAEFDTSGHAVTGTDEWLTDKVSFGSNLLPVPNFYEDFLTGNQSLPTGENYIVSVSPLDAAARISFSNGKVSVSNGVRTVADIQYYDGLGRPSQSIGLNQSPTKTDYVGIQQYTGINRQTKNWLPVPMETDGQLIDENSLISAVQNYYTDNRPYNEVVYENSALDRISSSNRPGETWNNHSVTYDYSINGWGVSVHRYEVLTGGLLGGNEGEQLRYAGDYDDHELYLQTIKDEDNSSITTCVDKEGRLLLERRNGNDTYYVYDRRGLLRYVLSPLCSQQLTNGTHDLTTDSKLQQLAYCYQYDGFGNQIYKRLPGCEPQYLVYDALRQLVLKQDGNQRAADKWTIFGYDSIGRNVYTAEITTPQTHENLIAFYADKWQVEHFAKTTQANALSNTGYASTLMGTNEAKVLTVNYYDNYDFLDKISNTDKKELKYQNKSGFGYRHDNAIGLLTGTRTYDLSDNSYIVTAYYYDYKGRIIQQRGTRHAGGYEKSWFRYNYDGSLAKSLTEAGVAEDIMSESYNYAYDHTGRLLSVRYKLNDQPEIELSENIYDNMGRLAQKLWGNTIDTIKYNYDMRGSLTHIRSKAFSEHLFYADSLVNGMSARYNGNIAAAYITHPDSVYRFVYSYDRNNRLTASGVLTPDGTTLFSEEFDYDANGNIKWLTRYNGSTIVDDLCFTYKPNSNQLASVTDYEDPADLSSVKEYYDNHSSTTEDDMQYDANGNLNSDADRGISLIKYNILNLPDTIQFTNGNQIVNLYDATGTKYKSIYYTLLPTVATPYYEIAHYGFNSDTVEYNITEYVGNVENRYSRYDTLRRVFNVEGYFEKDTLYCYYLDHLGNNVAVRNMMSDSIVQRTVYYASGLPMAVSSGVDKQPYKYNGKEFVEMHGLDEYDSKARWYYPTIMRTTTMDPMAEKYYHISPYAWCGNNPIKFVDNTGSIIKFASTKEQLVYYQYKRTALHKYQYWKNRVRALDKQWRKSDKTDMNLQKDLQNAKQKQQEYQQVRKELKTMEDNPTVFRIRIGENVIVDLGTNTSGRLTYNKENEEVDVNLKDMMIYNLAHELCHGYQYLDGRLDFSEDGLGGGDLYDLTDEREAYKRQSLFEEGVDDSTVDKKIEDILIKEYKGVPEGPISRPSVDIRPHILTHKPEERRPK